MCLTDIYFSRLDVYILTPARKMGKLRRGAEPDIETTASYVPNLTRSMYYAKTLYYGWQKSLLCIRKKYRNLC